MGRLLDRPFFSPGSLKAASFEILAEREGCMIERIDDIVRMSAISAWCDGHTALAHAYKVNELDLTMSSFGERPTADFLLDLPGLTRLTILLSAAKDLTAVGRLNNLESLSLGYKVWRLGDRFAPVDFSALKRLRFVAVDICPAFASILTCTSIRQLSVTNDCDRKLRDLDLSRLRELRELSLAGCPKLRRVDLHPRARIHALRVSTCGSYQIDWERVGPQLRFLALGARINFPLEDILKAPELEELHCIGIRSLPPLGFLRHMRKLRHVLLFAAPPGPKLSEEDRATVREINARGGLE
jgi:hypothetical protein